MHNRVITPRYYAKFIMIRYIIIIYAAGSLWHVSFLQAFVDFRIDIMFGQIRNKIAFLFPITDENIQEINGGKLYYISRI